MNLASSLFRTINQSKYLNNKRKQPDVSFKILINTTPTPKGSKRYPKKWITKNNLILLKKVQYIIDVKTEEKKNLQNEKE